MNETIISLDMLQSTGVGALALLLGMLMTRNIKWLQKFCIPSPVSGGLVFSIATLILYKVFHIELSFDGTLKDVFMLAFFTSVGFQSNLKVLRQDGKTLVLMLVLLVGIIVLQNVMPLISILVCQVIVMVLLTYFLAFRLLGSDYDAAVLVAGICGFGLGATPNAMANMSAVCYKYHYTVKPFLIVPIIGAMFVDLINTGIITTFLNWIG